MNFIDRLACVSFGLLLIRLVLAAVFMFHGSQKLFGMFGGKGMDGFIAGLESMGAPMPVVSAWAAACAEFFGGLILLIGNGTRIAAAFLAFTMLVAIVLAHSKAFSLEHKGMEYALTLGVVSLALVLMGPGHITLFGMFSKPSRP